MDKLDKILLQYLPDTGLCARGRRIQADRRVQLRAEILAWFLNEAINNVTVHKEEYRDIDPYLIVDEMQMDIERIWYPPAVAWNAKGVHMKEESEKELSRKGSVPTLPKRP